MMFCWSHSWVQSPWAHDSFCDLFTVYARRFIQSHLRQSQFREATANND